jgi:CubicO group peptidase (beta-lactamase class C family)
MTILTTANVSSFGTACLFVFSATALGQADAGNTPGITGDFSREHMGQILFTAQSTPVEDLQKTHLLKNFEWNKTAGLAMTAFMPTSLSHSLRQLAPELSADELTRYGSYQLRFYVDGGLVTVLSPAGIPAANKNAKTVFSLSLISSGQPESRWSVTWHRFLLDGGDQVLASGKHSLRIELRPALKATKPKVGDVIAAGELPVTVIRPTIDEVLTKIQPIQEGSGWQVSSDAYDQVKIRELNHRIAARLYKDIKSLVVIRDGQLLIEEYFNGANRDTLHNIRSAGKSFTSTLMGIAIHEGHIRSEDQVLGDFYDLPKFANYSPKKEKVTIKSLLTMSSGFDATDDDPKSLGNEERMYPAANWVKFALGLPMDPKTDVGEKWRYFTAGVIVLGDILNKSVPDGLKAYADQKLFQPLGIRKYEWGYTPQKVPNTAGGLRMRALDLAKYGQLYQNGGRWEEKQILPQSWVNKTFTKYLAVPYGNVSYGYLFWNTTFHVDGKAREAFFATGNGGNKIFVLQDEPLVVVITATAFGKWYMHEQIDSMMQRYILPAVINSKR